METQGLVVSRSGLARNENWQENHSTGKKTNEDKMETGTRGNMENSRFQDFFSNIKVPGRGEPYTPSGDIFSNNAINGRNVQDRRCSK